ncbi:hypothetical protein CgunFtcFv8_021467 [Champsocephalus gunnari]|uniref:Uncharacterized protein n=1 Tax=Champsocephalus gunnari TaxID=52237 RepID=A0AAN8DX45_CHAGU|nr:hypothetical protein CgunFtcFv8_021467 [Champsocephalus gunnari]
MRLQKSFFPCQKPRKEKLNCKKESENKNGDRHAREDGEKARREKEDKKAEQERNEREKKRALKAENKKNTAVCSSSEESSTNEEAEGGLQKTHSREKGRAEKRKRSGNKKGALRGSTPAKCSPAARKRVTFRCHSLREFRCPE